MNTFTNSTRILGFAFAALLLLAAPFVFASPARAADLNSGYDYYPDYSYDSGYDYYPDYSYDSGYDYYPDYSYDSGYDYYPDYSYDSGYDYGYTDYGYSYPSYSYPSYSYPTSYNYPSAPSYSNTNVNTNVNQNTCTNGSCNTSSSVNAPTTIVTNYPATPTYTYPQQTCNTCGCSGYPSCYVQPTYQGYYQPAVAYNPVRAPYVSLAAVPYTGLDLGPWGTAMYWGFLVLWTLIAAYLIAVKRVHNKFVAWLTGSSSQASTQTHAHSVSEPAHAAPAAHAPTPKAQDQFSGIDPFIASQIKRASF